VVGPRDALRTSRICLRDVNWLGDRPIEQAIGDRRQIYVKVRSTRAPQAAWLDRGADGFEVELIGGEDGVSPGQACVFYDAAQGQARVLGGGIIDGTMSSARATGAAETALAGAR
jgi:tRNA-specific 2-thiouridylase